MQRAKKTSLILLALLVISLTSCTTHKGAPLQSLCILDFEAKVCWVNKAHGVGFSFDEMNGCDSGGKCWFAIDEHEIERIFSTLNKGK